MNTPSNSKPSNPRLIIAVAALLFALGTTDTTQAQGYISSADLGLNSSGGGYYNYTLTLNNNSSSMNPIGTFWFGWVPDVYSYDLLPSNPSDIVAPSGWTAYGGQGYGSYYYPDGYSIEFIADTPLAPGSSATFQFTSADSPATLEATSPFFGASAATSYLYNSYAYSDAGAEISVPLVVPEPSSLSMIIVGAIGMIISGCRLAKRGSNAATKL